MTELPSGWKLAPLAEVTSVILGQSPPGSSYNTIGEGIPFFQGKSEFGELHPSVRQWTTSGTKFAESGDVLVSVRAPVGPTNVADQRCAIGRGLAALRAGPEVDPAYLLWAMRATAPTLASKATGTTFSAVTGAVLKAHAIPVAPLDEQQRIVATLEDHLSRLDAATSSITHARTLSAFFRRSLANDVSAGWAVTPELRGQLDAEGRPLLGPGWSWKSVEEITGGVKSNVTIGPFGSNLKVADYCESGTPLVFVRNIRSKEFLPPGQPHISKEKAATLTGHQAVKGDVLVTKMGDPPGDSAVYPLDEPAVITSDCLRLRPTGDFLPEYLGIAIESGLVRSQILAITSGVAQKKVSLARFRRGVLIPCPAFSMQVEMADRFNSAIDATQRSINGARHLDRVDALRLGLLDAAFNGELGVREVGSADV